MADVERSRLEMQQIQSSLELEQIQKEFESFRAEFGKPSPDYQLFRATGGKTGFMAFREIEDIAKDLSRQLRDAERSGLNPLWLGPALLRFIEKINAGFENATRFASWQAARASGMTLAEASSVSKNITVNFNRRGTLGPQVSAWVLFFNPAVQGTARIAQALKSPKVLATLGGAMTGVASLALANASMGGDDDDGVAWWDKIPAEVKDRNLIFILPPSWEELRLRLTRRGEDHPEVIEQRMANARDEVPHARDFDFVIINALFETALFDLKTVVHSQRLKYAAQRRNKSQVFTALNLI